MSKKWANIQEAYVMFRKGPQYVCLLFLLQEWKQFMICQTAKFFEW